MSFFNYIMPSKVMYVVPMLPVLCRRPLSCTYVCVGVHKCVMRMHRAFHVSPWRHVSGVDPSLYSDSSGEREATAELQTVGGSHSHSLTCRCDQMLAAILWKCILVGNHSVCVYVKGHIWSWEGGYIPLNGAELSCEVSFECFFSH